jgi:hypothetical protein
MADKNFNQGHQSQQDWDRNRDRSEQENNRSSQSFDNSNYSSNQNRSRQQRYGDVGYSGDSVHGMGAQDQGNYNRVNYIPDNNDNRDERRMQGGSSGQYGYRNEGRSNYGNAGHEGNYGQQDWNRNRGFGNQSGNENDWNRRDMQQSSGGSWSSDHGWQGRNRSNMNYGRGDDQRDYGNRNYGGGYGNMSNDYGRNDWNRSRSGNDDRYDSRRQDNNDNWWERTKDKVSGWFDDDDNDDRRKREYGGGHRGKGPTDYRRSQDRIREDICDRLTDDDRVDASSIRVQIEDDVVILSGTVHSRDEKRRAEDLVESVSGVRNVENRLRVGAGSGTERHLASHDYTGTTDRTGGIGTESGTTNEVIRNVQNDRNEGTAANWKDEV